MLTVAPGGNNLATICYKDFLGLATINMYYYYYYYVIHNIYIPINSKYIYIYRLHKYKLTNVPSYEMYHQISSIHKKKYIYIYIDYNFTK